MSATEDRARAAMRAIAVTVHDAPPLQLSRSAEPAPVFVPPPASGSDEVQFGLGGPRRLSARARSRDPRRPGGVLRPEGSGRDRRWRAWAVPAAAGLVVVLAVALVSVKHLSNGGTPAAASALPGGVPLYYAAIQTTKQPGVPGSEVLVGDSLTGKAIATVEPPSGLTFESVSAATDDRTFVVLAMGKPGTGTGEYPGVWFELRLAPGTAHPATLHELPIKAQFDDVIASAVSASGQELAVGGSLVGTKDFSVQVFSLATGKRLDDWTGGSDSEVLPNSQVDELTQYRLLTWIDEDHALALVTASTSGPAGAGQVVSSTVSQLNVDGTQDGNLATDSQPIWDSPPPSTTEETPCGGVTPLVSADGNTVSCAGRALQAQLWLRTFITYHIPTGPVSPSPAVIAYQVPLYDAANIAVAGLWSSPSGDTLIGEWSLATTPTSANSPTTDLGPVHIGVISRGKFTPLRLPPGLTAVPDAEIAW